MGVKDMKYLKTYEAWMTPIVKLDMDGNLIEEYECIGDAAKANSINRTDISNVLSGRRKSVGGFKWMTKYDYGVKSKLLENHRDNRELVDFKAFFVKNK